MKYLIMYVSVTRNSRSQETFSFLCHFHMTRTDLHLVQILFYHLDKQGISYLT